MQPAISFRTVQRIRTARFVRADLLWRGDVLPRSGRPSRRRERPPIHQITGARPGVRDDVNSRTRRYLISMGVRTVCFLLAVVTDGWLRWVMIAAAVVLPYLSVVFANSGRERIEAFPGMAAPTPKAIDGPASRDR